MLENIEMSAYGADFIRNSKRLLFVEGSESMPIDYQPHGFLHLATNEEDAYLLERAAGKQLYSPSRITA